MNRQLIRIRENAHARPMAGPARFSGQFPAHGSIPIRMTIVLAVLAILALASPSRAADRKPNVIVILADDLGYADLGVHGCRDIPTPHIDSLARDGVRCASGYVTAPVCSPTRAALLTGRYQQRFGHEFNPRYPKRLRDGYGLSLDETTIAQRLRPAGYATAMFGKWHLGFQDRFNPVSRGFDEFYGFLGGSHSYLPGTDHGQEATDPRFAPFRGARPADMTEYATAAFAREAVTFIDRHKSVPFFLYLPFNAVHTPMHAPPGSGSRFRHVRDPRRRVYAGMVSAMDDAVGAVLDKLRREGLEQDTLVFFLSDNGGPTANASTNGQLRGRKATTWEGGVRVPFLVRWKGRLQPGTVYEKPVAQIDILPTALAAAGVAVDPAWKLDGVDLLPFLEGKNSASPHEALFWRFGQQTAVRMGDWKLVRARAGAGRNRSRGPAVTGPHLFDLAADPGERNDLAAKEPARAAELQAAWDRWNAQLPPPGWRGPDAPRVP